MIVRLKSVDMGLIINFEQFLYFKYNLMSTGQLHNCKREVHECRCQSYESDMKLWNILEISQSRFARAERGVLTMDLSFVATDAMVAI